MNWPRIAFVTCVHPYYDLPAVTKHRDAAVAGLEAAGCQIVLARIPESAQDAVQIAGQLMNSQVDLVVLFFCTWVAEDVTLTLAREVGDLPLLLWALPYLDRDIPMPSPLSGLTASGSNLRRLGKPFGYLIGPADPERIREVIGAAGVSAVLRKLRRVRFGLVGAPCPGMLDVGCDEADLGRVLGLTTVQLELEELLKAAERASGEEAVRLARELIARVGAIEGVTEGEVAENLRLYLGMKELVRQHQLDGYCVRCWPELRNQLPLTACLAQACLSAEGTPSACERDLPALVTTYVLSQLAGAPAFSFDLTAYLEEEEAVQLAHCGAAALSLAADPAKAVLRRHMRTGTGVTLEFAFEEGTVTLAKLLLPVRGRLRLFAARGQVISTPSEVRGSVATVRPEPSAAAFIDTMMREGVEHHLALAYGDWSAELAQFCELAGLRLLNP